MLRVERTNRRTPRRFSSREMDRLTAAGVTPAAFAAAVDAARPKAVPAVTSPELLASTTFDGEVRRLVELRAGELVRYQNAKVARRYVDTVQAVWQSEEEFPPNH